MSNPHPVLHWPRRAYWDEAWLRAEYVGKGRSAVSIARECGGSHHAVYDWLKRFEIPCRTKADAARLREARKRGRENVYSTRES
jgi:hypothetical protein